MRRILLKHPFRLAGITFVTLLMVLLSQPKQSYASEGTQKHMNNAAKILERMKIEAYDEKADSLRNSLEMLLIELKAENRKGNVNYEAKFLLNKINKLFDELYLFEKRLYSIEAEISNPGSTFSDKFEFVGEKAKAFKDLLKSLDEIAYSLNTLKKECAKEGRNDMLGKDGPIANFGKAIAVQMLQVLEEANERISEEEVKFLLEEAEKGKKSDSAEVRISSFDYLTRIQGIIHITDYWNHIDKYLPEAKDSLKPILKKWLDLRIKKAKESVEFMKSRLERYEGKRRENYQKLVNDAMKYHDTLMVLSGEVK